MRDLGLVAPSGTFRNDKPIPLDILANDRGRELAEVFRSNLQNTEYYRRFFLSDEPIPLPVLKELGEAVCLCQLKSSVEELEKVKQAILGRDADNPSDSDRRREAFALFLHLLDEDSGLAVDEGNFRRGTWDRLDAAAQGEGPMAETVGRWAALHGKEYMQEGLRLLWLETNRLGRLNMPAGGFWPSDFNELVKDKMATGRLQLPAGTVEASPGTAAGAIREALVAASLGMTLEDLRRWARQEDSGLAGIALLLIISARLDLAAGFGPSSGWSDIGGRNGFYQPGLLLFCRGLEHMVETSKSLAECCELIVRRSIILAHDRIATSKLPDFTFRFRHESGRPRFFSLPGLDFPLADSRYGSIRSLSKDLGLWRPAETGASITAAGRDLVSEVFI